MFTIKQLEALYWSSSLGSFEAAASYLHISQSTVSKRIAELERQFPEPLFERSGRQSILTVRGEAIREIAEQMLRLNDRLVSAARGTGAQPLKIRLGVTDLIAVSWLPELIQRIETAYPGVEIEPEIDLSNVLVDRLLDRKIDFVICVRGAQQPQFISEPLDAIELVWMCSPKLLAGRTSLDQAELLSLTLLAQSSASVLRPMLYPVVDNENLTFSKKINCNNMGALAELAANHMGITILPRSFFYRYVQSGRLCVVNTPIQLPQMSYHITYRDDYYREFFASVAQICRDIRGFTEHAEQVGLDHSGVLDQ